MLNLIALTRLLQWILETIRNTTPQLLDINTTKKVTPPPPPP